MSNKKIRVAINGFGRIGRGFLRAAHGSSISVVAINDIGDLDTAAYLLRHDSVYGKSPFSVASEKGNLLIDGEEVSYLSEKDPAKLPWSEMDIDVVVESTGHFESFEKASAHLSAGAKRVVISAPVKDTPPAGISGATVLIGINEEKLATCTISSNASCTTNAGSPLMAILDEALGIEKALLNTVHAYTATQAIVDSPSTGDVRRGRAGAINIVPSSTGAATATAQALPQLEGKFDGIAIRVPVPAGSLVDVTFVSKRDTTAQEVNNILRDAAGEKRWKGIFETTSEPIVSSDIVGSSVASIADLSFTRVVGGNLVKVLAWYDNEMGYAHTLVRHVTAVGTHL